MNATSTFGGQIMVPQPDGRVALRPGRVHVANGVCARVDLGDVPNDLDWGGPDALICPGFVDTHLHLPQFDVIGACGMKLLPWLDQVIFPAEARWNDLAFANEMIQRVISQCVGVGTTTLCGYATVSHPATCAALGAFDRAGLSGVIGQVLMDDPATPNELKVPPQLALEQTEHTLCEYPPGSRMAAAVTPRFALACTESLLRSAGQLASRYDAVVQTHLAETTAECQEVQRRFDARDYVRVYAETGLLGAKSILGHGIHLDPGQREQLAATDSIVAHCPTANSFLGSGIMNRRLHRQSGIPITLGSDIGAGFERSMVRVGRAMIDSAMQLAIRYDLEIDDPENVPTAAHAWHQITTGNADALGWSDRGRIQSGAAADLVLIQPDILWLETQCPLSTLMFAWDDRWIQQTIVGGKTLYRSTTKTGAPI